MTNFEPDVSGLAAVGRLVSNGPAIDLFSAGDSLYASFYSPDGWHLNSSGDLEFDLLGAPEAAQSFLYRPSACSWAPDRLDVFAVSTSGDLWHFWSNSEQQPAPDWSGESLGHPPAFGILATTPAAVTQAPDQITVFARTAHGGLVACVWDPANGHRWDWWSAHGLGWAAEPAHITLAVAVSSWDQSRIDLFDATGDVGNGAVLHHTWQQDFPGAPRWHPDYWEAPPSYGGLTSSATAVSWTDPDQRIIVVYCTGNIEGQRIGMTRWITDHWDDGQIIFPLDAAGQIASYPAICSWGPNRADVFFFRADGQLQHGWNDDAGGSTPWNQWENFVISVTK